VIGECRCSNARFLDCFRAAVFRSRARAPVVSSLPRAGGWMNSAKELAMEVAAAMKFLSNVDSELGDFHARSCWRSGSPSGIVAAFYLWANFNCRDL